MPRLKRWRIFTFETSDAAGSHKLFHAQEAQIITYRHNHQRAYGSPSNGHAPDLPPVFLPLRTEKVRR